MNGTMFAHTFSTPLGDMVAAATGTALCMLEFVDRDNGNDPTAKPPSAMKAETVPGRNAIIDRTEEEVRKYFAGELKAFTIPLELQGTPFRQSVWNELLAIPYGRTWSYATLARRLGDVKTIRAAARANGQNRIAILVPCHRVIGSDGSLVGYAGGLWRKKELLALEGATAPVPEGQERLL